VETRGGDRANHRYVGYRGFELTEDFCHRGSESPEITRSDQDRPSEECVEEIRALERFSKTSIDITGIEKSGIPWTRSPTWNREVQNPDTGEESSIVGAS
jgi:hypothetical protein